eukprot:scaffold34391_cov21-Tisochrysis_lutea.AAC.2
MKCSCDMSVRQLRQDVTFMLQGQNRVTSSGQTRSSKTTLSGADSSHRQARHRFCSPEPIAQHPCQAKAKAA